MPDDRLPAAPTPEMIAAGVEALSQVVWDMETYHEIVEEIFAAMIAKAPPSDEPPAPRVRMAEYAPDVAVGAHTHTVLDCHGQIPCGMPGCCAIRCRHS